jgi:hypothetical protein
MIEVPTIGLSFDDNVDVVDDDDGIVVVVGVVFAGFDVVVGLIGLISCVGRRTRFSLDFHISVGSSPLSSSSAQLILVLLLDNRFQFSLTINMYMHRSSVLISHLYCFASPAK